MRTNLPSSPEPVGNEAESIGLATRTARARLRSPYSGNVNLISVRLTSSGTRRSLMPHIEATVHSANEMAATGILRPFHKRTPPVPMRHIYVRSQFRTHPTYGEIVTPEQDLHAPTGLEQFIGAPDLFVTPEQDLHAPTELEQFIGVQIFS